MIKRALHPLSLNFHRNFDLAKKWGFKLIRTWNSNRNKPIGISPLERSMWHIHAQTSAVLPMISTPPAFRISCADSLEILRMTARGCWICKMLGVYVYAIQVNYSNVLRRWGSSWGSTSPWKLHSKLFWHTSILFDIDSYLIIAHHHHTSLKPAMAMTAHLDGISFLGFA